MKSSINGRIVGHHLFTPDKKAPNVELVRVEIDCQPVGTTATDKNSRAVLIIDPRNLDRFPLKGSVRITIEDAQQILPLGRAAGQDDLLQ